MAVAAAARKPAMMAAAVAASLLAAACAVVVADPELDRPAPIPAVEGAWPHLEYRASGIIDELRSHLPARLQQALGLNPFVYMYHPCFDSTCWRAPYRVYGWDHEDYLRAVGRDVHGPCYDEYKRFAARLGWIEGNGYWAEFMRMCEQWTSSTTAWFLAQELPRALEKDCAQAIAAGWVVGDDGRFYDPDLPGRSFNGDMKRPGHFVSECLPLPPDYETFGYMGTIMDARDLGPYIGYTKSDWLEYPKDSWRP